MEILVPPKGLDDIPAETVDIDPTAFDPLRLGLAQERRKRVVVEFLNGQMVLGKVDDSDLARSA
jgi:hypothetical protein